MEIIAKKVGFGFSSLSYAGCAVIKMNNGDLCNNKYNHSKSYLNNYEVVILAQRWSLYLDKYYESKEDFLNDLSKNFALLSKNHKLVLIVGETPLLIKFDNININSENIHRNITKIDIKRHQNISIPINNYLKNLASQYPNIYYIDFNNIVCSNQDSCKIMVDNNLLYHDDRHFSAYGSSYIGKEYIKGQIDEVFYKIKTLYHENNKNLDIYKFIKQYKADIN